MTNCFAVVESCSFDLISLEILLRSLPQEQQDLHGRKEIPQRATCNASVDSVDQKKKLNSLVAAGFAYSSIFDHPIPTIIRAFQNSPLPFFSQRLLNGIH